MFPASVNLRHLVQQLPSQEGVGCCTANATLLAAEMTLSTVGRKANFSRLYLYYMTRKMQNRPFQKGAELLQALRALEKYGACTEQQWPFSHHRVDIEPHLPAINEGVHYTLRSFETTTPQHYKELLNNHIPIVVGMVTGRMFWNLKGNFAEHGYKPVNSTDNRQSNGHAVVVVGYDDTIDDGVWIVANSLGPKWGSQGYGAIPYACYHDIGESYIITNFDGITAGKKISVI